MNVVRKTANFFQKNFSGRQFKVQLASGAFCTAARAAAAYVTYEVTDHNVPLTVVATQFTSGISYVSSYATLFFPLANRDKYGDYFDGVKAGFGYSSIEQIPSLVTISLASANQFGAMQLGWPILSDPVVAAIVGSWGLNKVINLATGMSGSNILYRHGGVAMFKGAFASLEDRLAPVIVLGYKIGQYMPKF